MKLNQPFFREWENGCNKTLLVLPTGCGKTIVFAKITEECVRKRSASADTCTQRRAFLEQAADKIMKTTGLGCVTEKSRRKLYRQLVQSCCRFGTKHLCVKNV